MTRWLLAPEAADDLDRLTEFLLTTKPNIAVETVDLILDALNVLARHPRMGRPMRSGLREFVISRDRTGHPALYSHDEQTDVALVLAVRHQREQEYR